MTPELIGILAVGATVIGLLLTFRREARADNQALRAEFRADNQRLRAGEEIRSDLAALRDVQALTERMQGVIEGLFVGREPQRRRLTPNKTRQGPSGVQFLRRRRLQVQRAC